MNGLDKIKKDPRVQEVWNETSSGDGYWVILKTGYCMQGEPVHSLHEYKIKDLLDAVKSDIKPCKCKDCL